MYAGRTGRGAVLGVVVLVVVPVPGGAFSDQPAMSRKREK
jgi:hypothetical protein